MIALLQHNFHKVIFSTQGHAYLIVLCNLFGGIFFLVLDSIFTSSESRFKYYQSTSGSRSHVDAKRAAHRQIWWSE